MRTGLGKLTEFIILQSHEYNSYNHECVYSKNFQFGGETTVNLTKAMRHLPFAVTSSRLATVA